MCFCLDIETSYLPQIRVIALPTEKNKYLCHLKRMILDHNVFYRPGLSSTQADPSMRKCVGWDFIVGTLVSSTIEELNLREIHTMYGTCYVVIKLSYYTPSHSIVGKFVSYLAENWQCSVGTLVSQTIQELIT